MYTIGLKNMALTMVIETVKRMESWKVESLAVKKRLI